MHNLDHDYKIAKLTRRINELEEWDRKNKEIICKAYSKNKELGRIIERYKELFAQAQEDMHAQQHYISFLKDRIKEFDITKLYKLREEIREAGDDELTIPTHDHKCDGDL